jgi:hypothetical protein
MFESNVKLFVEHAAYQRRRKDVQHAKAFRRHIADRDQVFVNATFVDFHREF